MAFNKSESALFAEKKNPRWRGLVPKYIKICQNMTKYDKIAFKKSESALFAEKKNPRWRGLVHSSGGRPAGRPLLL